MDKVVEHAYDYQNRWVRKRLDGDGDGHTDQRRLFACDGNQIVMDFWRANSGDLQIGHLRERYLWGPAVDQILAEEEVDGGTADLVAWTLTDHLNTVRDIAKYDPQTGATTVVNHLVYDAFGRVTPMGSRRREPAVEPPFLFTARPFEGDTGLQSNLNRWYDPVLGRWLSEDPIGFDGGDANLFRYVLNSPTNAVDPQGRWVAILIPGGWTPAHCPQKCEDSPWGERFDAKWILEMAKDMAAEVNMRVDVIVPRLCGGTEYSLTCPAVNVRTGERMVKVCIPQKLGSTCEAMALLEHEYVHVHQLATGDTRSREQLETEAYTRQCEVYATQNCLRCSEEERKAWIRECVAKLRPQSLGGNVSTIRNACKKILHPPWIPV